jgi:hypothetical protein
MINSSTRLSSKKPDEVIRRSVLVERIGVMASVRGTARSQQADAKDMLAGSRSFLLTHFPPDQRVIDIYVPPKTPLSHRSIPVLFLYAEKCICSTTFSPERK